MNALAQFLLASAAVFTMADPARAELYDFKVTGDYVAHFQIDSSPVVSAGDHPGYFRVLNVAGTFAGIVGSRNVSFYEAPATGGGMAIWQFDPLVRYDTEMAVVGAQVFTGPIDAPTFLLGSYDFTGAVGAVDGKSVQLLISAVPEVDTWLMMIAGIGILGAAARVRNSKRASARFSLALTR
jgi:hypothetical protein